MDFTLPYIIKERLFFELVDQDNPFSFTDIVSISSFLKDFVNLKELKSLKSFKSVYDEFEYLISNDEKWYEDDSFIENSELLLNDDNFKKIVERIINTGNDSKRIASLAIVNRYIGNFDYYLRQDFNNGFLYYVIDFDYEKFVDIPKNDIIFNVIEKYSSTRIIKKNNFILKISDWDDYGYKTLFNLSFKDENNVVTEIGGVSILKLGEKTTAKSIDKTFFELSNEFCCLFVDEKSYFKLKDLFEDKYISVLSALKDVAYFPKIFERFENEEGFKKSIFRDEKQAEKLARTLKLKLIYGDISNLFRFRYNYTPIYSDVQLKINFDFDSNKTIPKRLFCLIGKNGVGKTLFLKDLLLNFSAKNSKKISPQIPIYGKVVVVSLSYFDFFRDIKSTEDFNFIYCGLINSKTNRPYSDEEIEIKLMTLLDKLNFKNDIVKYYLIVNKFIDDEILGGIFDVSIWDKDYNSIGRFEAQNIIDITIIKNKISDFLKKLSSGQRALFFIITELIVNIRYNSLLIFDEPEIHLHPNAITEFMDVIMKLLEEFDSYGIIATHSPLIVREVFSDSIYVFEKEKNMPRVRKLEFETFGENLSTITEEIFGNRDVSKYYINSIEKLVNKGKSYQEIENEIQGEVPLSLNLKILIKSLVANRDEES